MSWLKSTTRRRGLTATLAILVGLAGGSFFVATPEAQNRTRIASGSSLPATCAVGDLFFKTSATIGLNQCTATDTWTAVGSGSGSVDDTAYDATTWNGDTTTAPSKNAVRDKIETIIAGGGLGTADIDTSAEIATIVGDELGSGKLIFSAGTLAVASGKTLTASNTLTLAGTDGSTVTFGAGGTVVYTTGIDTSAELATLLTDEVGSGKVVFSAGTLDVASGKTLTVSNTLTFTGTDASSVAFGAGGTVVYSAAIDTSAELATLLSDENGSGKLLFSAGTLDITTGKTAAITNTLTFSGTDSSTVLFGAGGTVLYSTAIDNTAYDATTWNGDSTHAPTKDAVRDKIEALIAGGGLGTNDIDTSAELRSILTDETGGGAAVFATAPVLAAPQLTFAAKTASYTVTTSDDFLSADATGTSVTITFDLPTAASKAGRSLTFIRIDTDLDGTVVLDGSSSETIDGASTYSIPIGQSVTIVSNGTNWLVISGSNSGLTDPNADRFVGWDDSLGKLVFATIPPARWTYATGVCQGSTASLGLSALTSLAPTAFCLTGTNVTSGWAQFPDSDGNYELQGELLLPSDWDGTLSVNGVWRTAATSGDIKLYVTVACSADAETRNDTWVAAGNVVETAKGTTLQLNTWSISSLTTTGCAAGEVINWRVYRQRTDAADTLASTFILGPITFTAGRGI